MSVRSTSPGSDSNVVAFPTALGQKLRSRRTDLGLTQADLAERLGVSRGQTIAAWEKGERPQRRFDEPIADFLGLAGPQAVRDLLAPSRPVDRRPNSGLEGSQPDGVASPDPIPTSAQQIVSVAIAAQLKAGKRVSEKDHQLYDRLLRGVGLECRA